MDAAHKLIKTAVLFLLVALLMAAPGWAQAPTLNVTTSVSLSGTGGQDVPVTSSGAQITYAIGAPDYSSDPSTNGAWLRVTGGTTTPTTLAFNLGTVSGLSQGTHTATVTLMPDSVTGASAVMITVTYTSRARAAAEMAPLRHRRTH